VLPAGGLSSLMGHRPPQLPIEPTPPRGIPEPAHRRSRDAAALVAVIGVGLALRAVALYSSPAPRPDEAALVNQVADPVSIRVAELPGRLGPLASPQFAGLIKISDGWDRAPSALGALREVSLLGWAVTALLCWVLVRRLGVGRPWAMCALMVLALSPTAIAVTRLAVPENVGACWGLAALVLAAGPTNVGRAQFRADLMIAGCLAVGALTAPVTAAVIPAVVLLSAWHGDLRRTLLLGLMCLPAAAAAALTSGGFHAPAGTGVGTWLVSGWLGLDLVTAGVALAVALVALASVRHRWIGAALLTVAGTAALLGLPANGLYPLVVPLAAVGIAGLGQDRPLPDARRWPPRLATAALLVPPAILLPAGVLTVLTASWSGNLLGLSQATEAPPTEWAREWLRGNVPATEQVMTDDIAHAALAAGGAGWDRLLTPAICDRQARLSAAPTSASACNGADWWVVAGSAVPTTPATDDAVAGVRQAAGVSVPAGPATLVARFGTDGSSDRIEVWTTHSPATDPAREARGRQAAGQMLVASRQLEIGADLADRLRSGVLDSRAATALGGLLSELPIRVVDLPEVAGEQAIGRPIRQLLLGPAPAGAARRIPTNAQQRIVDFFTAQLAPFRPYSMAITPSGVLVRYSPQGPPGLLDSLLTQ
jgi:hypothetical protein